MHRFKPPLILSLGSVNFAALQFTLVGMPGPCGGGGLLDTFIAAHPALDAVYYFGIFTLLIAFAGAALGAIWLVYALVCWSTGYFIVRRAKHPLTPCPHLP